MTLETFNNFMGGWWPYIISFIVTVITSIRVYMGGPQCPSQNRLDGKVVLITGGSGGIGFETAKELVKRGATIILTCRNFAKGQKAVDKLKKCGNDVKIDLKILDVSEMGQIRRFVMLLKKNYKKIDILINNAGVIFQPYKKTTEGFEVTFATNYLGPFLLTYLLLPLLKQSTNGRVINLAALSHVTGRINMKDLNMEKRYSDTEAFAQSKLALIMFSRHLAKQLEMTSITVYAINPGIVRNTSHLESSPFTKSLMARIATYPWVWLFLKTPKQGCQTVVYAATEPGLGNLSGVYLSDCEIKDPSDYARNDCTAKQLYEVTRDMIQLKQEETLGEIML